MKKFLVVILSAVMLLTLFVPAVAADEEHPSIYVMGARVTEIYAADGTRIFPMDGVDEGEVIKQAIKPCLEKLAMGLVTKDYEAWAKEFHAAVIEIMGDLSLDANGEVSDGSYAEHPYDYSLPVKTSGYGSHDYRLWYDWRLSPIDTAEYLKLYIEDVKRVTEEEKVNLIGRCYGANVVQAYLTLYPEHAVEHVDDVAYLASSVDGIDALGALFNGDIELDGQAVENFVDYYMENGDLIEDEGTRALVMTTVELFNQIKLLGITCDALELFIDEVREDIFPLVLLDVFAGWPSYWAMLPADEYESAREFLFDGIEEEYAGFIKKCDDYHYKVQLKAEETLMALDKKGIDFYMISKYNFPDFPLYEDATALSDGNTTVKRQSFGATCADHGEILSDRYINSLENKDYLSPDLKIDASTCLFPETSYFIKNMHHETFPSAINNLALKVMNTESTVSGGEVAQFLLYTGSSQLSVIDGVDEDATKPRENVLATLMRFLTSLLNMFTRILRGEISVG